MTSTEIMARQTAVPPHLACLAGLVPPSLPWPVRLEGNSRSPVPVAARSGIEALAELSTRLPRRASGAIEILMTAARAYDDGFQPLQPLWVQEAIHRAFSMLRLFTALNRRKSHGRSHTNVYERRLALHLAAELASLETTDLTRRLPCSGPLREAARDLVALFGPAVGRVVIATDVAPLCLPAYKRRALVLLGTELVTNALTHAFQGRNIGEISIRLDRSGARHGRLRIGDDGVGFVARRPNPATSVAGGLADLLEGDIRYVRTARWGTAAELVFPLM